MSLPQRSAAYLRFVRTQSCLAGRISSQHQCSGNRVDAHHAYKFLLGISEGGLGRKGSDYLCIPLCRGAHQRRHTVGKELLDDPTCLREIVRLLLTWFCQAGQRRP